MAVALLPKTRRALLGLLYGLPDRAFYLREIAARLGSGMGQVQRELGDSRGLESSGASSRAATSTTRPSGMPENAGHRASSCRDV